MPGPIAALRQTTSAVDDGHLSSMGSFVFNQEHLCLNNINVLLVKYFAFTFLWSKG